MTQSHEHVGDDHTRWLYACYDRAEQKARKAATWDYPNVVDGRPIGPVVRVEDRGAWSLQEWDGPDTLMVLADPESAAYPVAELVDAQFNGPWAIGEHITDLDPSWRLGDIARKRKILAEHDTDKHWPLDRSRVGCRTCRLRGDIAVDDEWPCKTVRWLAEEFAGEPGYDNLWRPVGHGRHTE